MDHFVVEQRLCFNNRAVPTVYDMACIIDHYGIVPGAPEVMGVTYVKFAMKGDVAWLLTGLGVSQKSWERRYSEIRILSRIIEQIKGLPGRGLSHHTKG